jgi:hypothetical protein
MKLLAGITVIPIQFSYSEYIVKQKKYLALVLLPLFINPASAAELDSLANLAGLPQVESQVEAPRSVWPTAVPTSPPTAGRSKRHVIS